MSRLLEGNARVQTGKLDGALYMFLTDADQQVRKYNLRSTILNYIHKKMNLTCIMFLLIPQTCAENGRWRTSDGNEQKDGGTNEGSDERGLILQSPTGVDREVYKSCRMRASPRLMTVPERHEVPGHDCLEYQWRWQDGEKTPTLSERTKDHKQQDDRVQWNWKESKPKKY